MPALRAATLARLAAGRAFAPCSPRLELARVPDAVDEDLDGLVETDVDEGLECHLAAWRQRSQSNAV
jgi:hypothetical protein